MARTRAYHRHQRERVISRKSRISHALYGWEYYEHRGAYSKGKIHCSCWMCRASDFRGRHIPDRGELCSMMKLREQAIEAEQNNG